MDVQAHDSAVNPPAPPSQMSDGGGSPAKAPECFYVLDSTAVRLTGHETEDRAKGRGARTHDILILDGRQQVVRSYTFQPGTPLQLPVPVAIKFLRNQEFIRTDENGNPLPYNRQPKQPDEFGAGAKFALPDHQTIADYGELTNTALWQRALEMPGGEAIDRGNRQALINFLIAAKTRRREANKEKEAAARAAQQKRSGVDQVEDLSDGEFIPPPELD